MSERARVVVDADADAVVREGRRAETAIRGVGAATRNQQRALDAGRAAVDKQRQSLSGLAREARAASLAVGAAGIYGGQKVVRDGFRFNATVESAELAMRRFIGTSRETDKYVRALFETAKDTPFEFTDLLEASRKLLAFGLSARQTKDTLDAMGDAIAAAGGGADKIGRVVTALGQIQAKNKVYAEELLQLTEAGIPAYRILARELGMTGEQVAKIGEQGIDAKTALAALTQGLREDFGGAAEEQSRTWVGLTSTMRDNWAQMTGALTQGLFSESEKWAPNVNRAMERIAAVWNDKQFAFDDKFQISRQIVDQELGPVLDAIGDRIADMNLDERLKEAVEKAAPEIIDALASAGVNGAEAFVHAWLDAGAWGKLLTAAFIASKLGAFRAGGSVAADMFGEAFKRRMAKSAAVSAAGSAAGTAAAGTLAEGMAAQLPASLDARKGRFASALRTGLKGTAVGVGVVMGSQILDELVTTIQAGVENAKKDKGPVGQILENLWQGTTGIGLGSTLKNLTGGGGERSGGITVGSALGDIAGTQGALTGAGVGSRARVGNGGRRAGTGGRQLTPAELLAGNKGSSGGVNTRTLAMAVARAVPGLRLGSGYRSPERNRAVGGVEGSYHTRGTPQNPGAWDLNGQPAALYAGLAWAQQNITGLAEAKVHDAGSGLHLHLAFSKNAKLKGAASGGVKLNSQQKTIVAAAQAAGIDPAILWGVYGQETRFGEIKSDSPAGAQGPFQLMPGTARELGVKNPRNFREAAFAAARYLARYKDRGVEGMLAAYNAGPAGNPNNPETRAYIPAVLEYARQFPALSGGGAGGADVSFDPAAMADAIAEQERRYAERIILPIARERARQMGPLNRLAGRYSSRADRYGQALQAAQRVAGMTEEDIANPAERDRRVGELTTIRDLQLNQGFAGQQRLSVIRRQIATWAAAVKKLRALLRKAKGAQRGVIKARIETYRQKIRELQAEARQLGETITAGGLDLADTMSEIVETRTEGARLQAQQWLGMITAQAGLTPGGEDDYAAANIRHQAAGLLYQQAVAGGNQNQITEAANELKAAADALENAGVQLRSAALAGFDQQMRAGNLEAVRAKIRTPGSTADDRAALVQQLAAATAAYTVAEQNAWTDEAIKWGNEVVSLTDAIRSLDESTQQNASVLADLYKQQRDDALKAKRISDAELLALSGFAPLLSGRMVGSFARGTRRVGRSGVALVHADEAIVPDPQGAFRQTARDMLAAPAQPVNVTLVAQGDLAPILSRLTAKVTGGAAQVSLEQGRRTRLIRAAPGRG